MVELSTRTGCPVTFLCFQVNGKPDFWRDQLAACEAARAMGGRLTAQISARTAGMVGSLRSVHHPFMHAPAWKSLAGLPHAEKVRRLKADPALRRAVAEQGQNSLIALPGRNFWSLIFLLSGGSGLAAVAVVYLAAMRLTDDRQRLRIDRLTATTRGSRP